MKSKCRTTLSKFPAFFTAYLLCVFAASCTSPPVPVDEIPYGKRSDVFTGSKEDIFDAGVGAITENWFSVYFKDFSAGLIIFASKPPPFSNFQEPIVGSHSFSTPSIETPSGVIPGATIPGAATPSLGTTTKPLGQSLDSPLVDRDPEDFLRPRAFAMRVEYLDDNTTQVELLSAGKDFVPANYDSGASSWILGEFEIEIEEESVGNILAAIRKDFTSLEMEAASRRLENEKNLRGVYEFTHAGFGSYRSGSKNSAAGVFYRRSIDSKNLIGLNASLSASTSSEDVVIDGRPNYYSEYEEIRTFLAIGADRITPLVGGFASYIGAGVGFSLGLNSGPTRRRYYPEYESETWYPNKWTPVGRIGLMWKKPGYYKGVIVFSGYQYSDLTPMSNHWFTVAVGYGF